jgi:hypothetical protein
MSTSILIHPQLHSMIKPTSNITLKVMNIFSGFTAQLVDKVDMLLIGSILSHIKNIWTNRNKNHFHYQLS